MTEQVHWLVTRDAQWVIADSPRFYAALGDSNPDYDAIEFAIKNLGFISLRNLHGAIIEIQLHPRNVWLPALLTVQNELEISALKLFRIIYLTTSWQSEITASRQQAISRLSELCRASVAAS